MYSFYVVYHYIYVYVCIYDFYIFNVVTQNLHFHLAAVILSFCLFADIALPAGLISLFH